MFIYDPFIDPLRYYATENTLPYGNPPDETILNGVGEVPIQTVPNLLVAETTSSYTRAQEGTRPNIDPKLSVYADWRMVYVPLDFLDDTRLNSTTKIVGAAIQVGIKEHLAEATLTSSRRLAKLLGMSRNTVRKALQQLKKYKYQITKGFCFIGTKPIGIPVKLILEKTIPASAKVIYGLLMGKVEPVSANDSTRTVDYSKLSDVLHFGVSTIKRAFNLLRHKKWFSGSQEHKHAPIHIKYTNPIQKLFKAVKGHISATNSSQGEGLMRGWCSLLIASDNHKDNFQSPVLINPDTGNPMHFDRFYLDFNTAIEFQGPQHFHATDLYDAKTVATQKRRDHNKKRICVFEGITFIEVQAEDLCLEGMLRKLEGKVPLRDLTGCQPIINYLQKQSEKYLNSFR